MKDYPQVLVWGLIKTVISFIHTVQEVNPEQTHRVSQKQKLNSWIPRVKDTSGLKTRLRTGTSYIVPMGQKFATSVLFVYTTLGTLGIQYIYVI